MDTVFKTNDVNLAAYLLLYYQLVSCEKTATGRFTFCFPSSAMLKQKVFLFFSKQADCNISAFCDNLRSLKAYMANA